MTTPDQPGQPQQRGTSTGPAPDDMQWPAGAAPHTPEELDALLASANRRRSPVYLALVHGANATGEWLRRHWLAVVNGFLATYVGLSVLTPIAFMFGLTGPATAVFRAYRLFCDELPTHSFFIGGYQMCLCVRCTAIYTSMLIAGLFLAFYRKRQHIRALRWWMWGLCMLPMALDGFTQLFGLRESNTGLRLLTGAIFGISTAWFLLPQIQAASEPDPQPARA
ncbi:MAG TPA: DUF2085 domain-containing protein [Ktedonobacterales bacterium]